MFQKVYDIVYFNIFAIATCFAQHNRLAGIEQFGSDFSGKIRHFYITRRNRTDGKNGTANVKLREWCLTYNEVSYKTNKRNIE